MRALGLGTKIAAACAAAVGLVLALGLPWYGVTPARDRTYDTGEVAGPLDGLFAAIPRWLAEPVGVTGWETAGPWHVILAGAAGLAALAALLCLLPSTEHTGRGLLQLAGLVCAGVVVAGLAVRPDGMEPRYGIFVALAVSVALVITAQGIAAASLRRKPLPPRRYAGTRPSYEQSGSVAPPGA